MKYLKKYKLFENQVFDYDGRKDSIILYIKNIKLGKEPFFPVNLFYGLIRGESKIDTANKLGFTNEQKQKWKESLGKHPFISDGVWSQIDYNRQLKLEMRTKVGKDIDYNYYITLIKEKENIIKFGQSLNDLNQRIHKFSYDRKVPISFKTHSLLDCICGDNDSLKIYYYDINLKDDIDKIVKEWIKTNDIKVAQRTHTHGVDVKKGTEDKKSWGIIIATLVDENFRKVIEEHGDKFTDEQYFEWFKKWFPNFIQKINFK
jgi:hypothetical protein